MAKTKYGKYIIYETPANPYHPNRRTARASELFTIDDDFLKGAFYLSCVWVLKAGTEAESYKQHVHRDWDEYLVYIGSNPADPSDLGGEAELWIEDEKHIITKSCAVFIPRGIQHTPCVFRRVDRPIFWFTTGPSLKHKARFSKDPKWNAFKEPPVLKGMND